MGGNQWFGGSINPHLVTHNGVRMAGCLGVCACVHVRERGKPRLFGLRGLCHCGNVRVMDSQTQNFSFCVCVCVYVFGSRLPRDTVITRMVNHIISRTHTQIWTRAQCSAQCGLCLDTYLAVINIQPH